MSTRATDARRWLVFGLLAAAQFMVILDASVITVALASIQEDLGFSASDLQWVVNAYVIAFGGLLLLGGRAADLLGRKRTFLGGLALFSAASLAGGLAQSELWLIAARAGQGIGAAFLAPAALSLVMNAFTDDGERNKALGLWGAVSGAAGAAGVLAGGTLTEAFGWESTLLVNVPIGIALTLAVALTVGESRERSARVGFDSAGALTVVAGVATLIYGIVNAHETGWSSTKTLATLGAAIALLGAFVVIERRATRPLIDLRLLMSRTIGGANLVSLVVAAAIYPMFYLGGLLMQQAHGFSALGAGVAWLPMSLIVMVTAGAIAPKLIGRFGTAPVLATGSLALAGGLLMWAHAATADGYLGGVLPALLTTAPGVGLVFVAVTVAATAGVAPHQSGLASGLVNSTQQVGTAIGIAVLVALSSSQTAGAVSHGATPADALGDGFAAAFTLAAGFAVTAAVVTVAMLVRRRATAAVAPAAVPAEVPAS
ncbi:MAG TPA: MFS transporter [Solirubrobacteraceae bacterium]|nr:MFS transporter [Solirubrobacteraceae bacterium]